VRYGCCSNEGIYSFFNEFAFFLDPINTLWEKSYTVADKKISVSVSFNGV